MSDALIAFYRRPHDETPAQFGARLRDAAAALAGKGGVRELVLLVDDGETGAPPEAAAYPSTFDAAVVANGLPLAALLLLTPRSRSGVVSSRRATEAVTAPAVRASP